MNTNALTNSVDRTTVRTVAKLLLAVVSLLFLLSLVRLLPGADWLVPLTSVSVGSVVVGIGALAVAGLLVIVASPLASLTQQLARGPDRVVTNLASIVHWLVVLAAVLVAHSGLAGVFGPLLGSASWLYDTAFLLAALVPLAFIAYRLYASLDSGADAITDTVMADSES